MIDAEKTLVLLKPDTVARGLSGRIIARLERAGLKIVASKMLQAGADLINRHYPPAKPEFLKAMGGKTLEAYQRLGVDAKQVLGSDDPQTLGKMIQKWNVISLSSGPVWALIVAGPGAIATVRKLRGATMPADAPPGTINGDFSFDSAEVANQQQRAVRNLMHASANAEEAEAEIKIWFSPQEIFDPQNVHQGYMFS